ncbi:hypothetical protein Q7P37_007097 [Cladosporium fusiforme]
MVSSTEEHNAAAANPPVEAQAVPGASASDEQDSAANQSKAVEMSDLNTPPVDAGSGVVAELPGSGVASTQPSQAEPTPKPTDAETKLSPSANASKQPTHPDLSRSQTAELALGPDGEPAPVTDPSVPALRITLMLTTGARHAYTISQKYLTSRKVTAVDASGNFDPREMSGYKLKELIWTDWRAEWEARPRDPSSIRLIIMGRMIDDKVALKDLPFSLPSANVVHMTIKPADLLDDEAEGGAKSGSKGSIRANNSGEEGGAGCRCVIL